MNKMSFKNPKIMFLTSKLSLSAHNITTPIFYIMSIDGNQQHVRVIIKTNINLKILLTTMNCSEKLRS